MFDGSVKYVFLNKKEYRKNVKIFVQKKNDLEKFLHERPTIVHFIDQKPEI